MGMSYFAAPATVGNSSDGSEDAITFAIPVVSAVTDAKVQEQERASNNDITKKMLMLNGGFKASFKLLEVLVLR